MSSETKHQPNGQDNHSLSSPPRRQPRANVCALYSPYGGLEYALQHLALDGANMERAVGHRDSCRAHRVSTRVWVSDHFTAERRAQFNASTRGLDDTCGHVCHGRSCPPRRVGHRQHIQASGCTANMAATCDHLSGGRHVLGLGAGWQVNEHEAYGIALPEVPERLARLDEACQVIRLLHSEDRQQLRRAVLPARRCPLRTQAPPGEAAPTDWRWWGADLDAHRRPICGRVELRGASQT